MAKTVFASHDLSDSIELTHDELIDRLFAARSSIAKREVADSFVAGIGQRRFEWCSAIGSYAVAMHFPLHAPDFTRPHWPCLVCELAGGSVGKPDAKIRFSPSHVARMRCELGGGAFNQASPGYATFDLEQFATMPLKPTPVKGDIAVLRAFLDLLRAAPCDATAAKLAQKIGKIAGANKYQRQQTIETLSTIGVLEAESYPSFWRTYTRFIDRPEPSGRNDWAFPAVCWRGRDGVNEAAVAFWFGHLLK